MTAENGAVSPVSWMEGAETREGAMTAFAKSWRLARSVLSKK